MLLNNILNMFVLKNDVYLLFILIFINVYKKLIHNILWNISKNM